MTLPHSPRLALLVLLVALADGYARNGDPAPTPANGRTAPLGLAVSDPRDTAPADEDPGLVAHAKAKGWSIVRDNRFSDLKRLIFLNVQNKDRPFDEVTLTPEDYKLIAKAKTVQFLNLRQVKCSDDGLKIVATNPRFEGILVNGEGVTDTGVKALAACKSLDYVSLFSTKKVTDAGVKELAALTKLEALHLAFLTLDGSAFAAFAKSKTLTTLNLEYIEGLTDEGAKHIGKLPAVEQLKLGLGFGMRKLTSAGIRAIVETRLPARFEFDHKLIDDALLGALLAKGWLYGPTPTGVKEKKPATPQDVQMINLRGSSVTDKGFSALLNCTNVTMLDLADTGVTDESLKKLGAFTKLNYLTLNRTKVGAAGLEAVSAAPIRNVSMESCEMTEGAFKALGKMKALEELWLSGAKTKGKWLKHIEDLPKLKSLTLMRTEFDDSAVPHLVAMPALEKVVLNDTQLTDAGFLELLKRPKLQHLYVDGTRVTKEVFQKAKKENPKRTLFFYWY